MPIYRRQNKYARSQQTCEKSQFVGSLYANGAIP